MDKVLLPPERVEELLGELCAKLGYCLPTPAHIRIINSPPRTVDRFTDVVIRADGDDPSWPGCRKVRRQVREVVELHFEAERQRQTASPLP
jgi:hypothetical protein